jgi:hypothetical protein
MPALVRARDEKLAQALAKGVMTLAAACIAAGFSGDPAAVTKKCRQKRIQDRVKELQAMRQTRVAKRLDIEYETTEAAAKALGISKRWVLERLKYNAERCLRGQPVFDAQGMQIPGKFTGRPDANGANQALRLIGLELGMFIERHEIGGPGDFTRLNDAEFEAKFIEEAKAIGLDETAVAGLLTYQDSDGTEK